MGPDGKLYFNIGAPGNIVMPSYMQASIMRVDPGKACSKRRPGRAQLGRLRLESQDQGAVVTNHGRDWLVTIRERYAHRVTSKEFISAIPSAIRAHARPRIRQRTGRARIRAPTLKLGAHIAPLA